MIKLNLRYHAVFMFHDQSEGLARSIHKMKQLYIHDRSKFLHFRMLVRIDLLIVFEILKYIKFTEDVEHLYDKDFQCKKYQF